jgi:N-acetylglucosaminyldiphosphoundecaprenol N-acetyl-beta-D-mannosaminyltransferase
MNQISFFNIAIDNLTMSELLGGLRHGGIVFTPNVDHLMKLQRCETFFRAYQAADYCVCDSQVLMFCSKWLGTPVRQKISGSDLLPAFYEYYQYDPGMTIFLLGAEEGIAAVAQGKINHKVNRLMVVGQYSPPWGFEADVDACQSIVNRVNESQATVLAVGLGAPKQEEWIVKHCHQMPKVKVFLAIGATIDFEAGVLRRSPQWMSRVGLEWLYRLIHEPQRLWSRYVGDAIPFFILVLQQFFHLYQNPWTAESAQGDLAQREKFVKQ